MILRRFMQHIREQNWFAVGLDVIVVIVGIFLGLQVTEWNEEREAKIQERIILEQIHDEIERALPIAKQRFSEQETYRRMIHEASQYMSGNASGTTLTADHCMAVSRSHIQVNYAPELASLSELINTGQLANLDNLELKSLVSEYIRARNSGDRREARQSTSQRNLFTNFPEVINVNANAEVNDLDHYVGSALLLNDYQCNFSAMAENLAFKNMLLANNLDFFAYFRALNLSIQLLEEIHSALSIEMRIS